MEVKLGVQFGTRELVVESTETADAVQAVIEKAVKDGGVLVLADEKGRRVVIPVDKLAYAEIASDADSRTVGFGRI